MLLIVAIFGNVSAKGNDDEKIKLIDEILLQTGQSSLAVGKQFSTVFITKITAVLKQSNPNVDPRAYDIIEKEVIATIDEEMVVNGTLSKMIYPIYIKHFTVKELEQMVALYKTDLGKKMISVMPYIAQESMQTGQKFGQTLWPKIQVRINKRFQEEGIKKL